ncbi:hypothetical protein [Acetivibrio ethanolgignens]|uniref:IrrE N-terminal-like domain-containing protein n=1 Tax=Acetivibrio ethanolgignens TaxID=290052 RepID=A0A0V8QHU7_9FIRM|nr:hypothetical protein [Acetivibrio ethanolgignens]KSV59814.1 hypothetical protein ASU35_08030 [Acetivibrio ethanolgignens]
MNNCEKLLDIANNDGIVVTEKFDFSQTRFKVLYCNGVIAINSNIQTNSEKSGILAEELGHHYTTFGNITDLESTENQNKANCLTLNEMAEHLEVSEEFLSEALEYYRKKYGVCTEIDNYLIYFEPSLGVMELI